MKSTDNLYVFWHDTIANTLFKFFGSYDISSEKLLGDHSVYFIDDFRIDIERSWNGVLFSVDLLTSFNKISQSPIHFIKTDKPISSRKSKRIFQALNYLKRNIKEAGTYFGSLPGFDDISHENRYKFFDLQKIKN